jgi:hypothetical protein
MESDDAAS